MQKLWILGITALALAAGPAAAEPASYSDEADAGSLLQTLARTEAYLTALKKPSVKLVDREVSVERLRRSVARFKALVAECWGTPAFEAALREEFEAVPMPGLDGAGKVHFTGYYQPLLEAREAPDAKFRFPLYAPPTDQVVVDAGAFKADLSGQRWLGRVNGGRVVPYYSRAEIEDGQALKGRKLELAYVSDELALFGLMVQGSGMLRFADGRVVNANYAGQNGHPYVSLGKTLIADGQIPAEQISMPAITAYFKQHPERLHTYLLKNPSYVFFQLASEGPFGSSGMQLVPGRAIATDKRLFPPGAIAYLEYPRAQFDAAGRIAGWETGGRFVVDQDTGGAILGPGRVDIYWGSGDEAARRAGTLNGNGRATFLLLKDGF